MIMHRNRNENRVGRRLAACAAAAARPLVAAGTAGILAAGMLTAAVLAGAAPAGAAPAPHKQAAASGAAAGSLPPIRSADGKIAPPAAGSGGWHVARARSGPGRSSAAGLHVFLPRTHKLVVPSGSSRGVPWHAAPGVGANHAAGVAPPRSLNVRPPAGARPGGIPGDIVIGTNFNGSGYTGWIPPDGGLATGPHQVIVAINGAFNVFGKGGTVLSSQTLASFFSGLPDASTAFDPHVQFDPTSQRFWVAAAASNGTTSSEIFVAVSNDSDALHGWSIFWMPVQGNFPHDWCDYPQIGLSSGGFVYLTCNMFSLPNAGGTATPMIRVMPESEFTGGGCCNWWEFWNLSGWSIQPTVMRNSATGNGEFLASSGNGSADHTIRQYRVTNEGVCCGSAPTLSESDIGVGSYSPPPCAVQPNSSFQCLDTGDARLLGAVWQFPYLYTWLDSSDSGFAKPDFVQINDTNNSVTQNWLLNFGSYYSMYPEVGVRPNGDMSMVTDEVSPSTANNLFASAWVIGIPNQGVCTVCTDGPAHFVAAGAGNYQRIDDQGLNRWGDYSGAAPDPDSTGIWAMGQFATNANTWNMQVQLTREAGDATPPTSSASLSPAPNSNGWNNSNVTVTIHATDAGSGVYYQTYSASGAGAFGTTTGGATVAPVIAAQGTTTVFFQATDNWYNSNSFQATTVRIDKTPPTIGTAPTVNLRNNAGPVTAADPVTISWSGSDATSGINHYSLYESKDGGAYTLAATTTAPAFNKNLGPGHTYQFEVTGTDNAGNTSVAKQGVVYKLSLVQENASAVKYTTPGWTRQALSGANGGSVDFATVKGKTATLTFTGFQVAWMSTQGPTRGSATVKLDSGTAATISTNTSSPHAAEVVDVVTAAANGSHKLVVNVLGTAGHPRIDVDAFIVLSK